MSLLFLLGVSTARAACPEGDPYGTTACGDWLLTEWSCAESDERPDIYRWDLCGSLDTFTFDAAAAGSLIPDGGADGLEWVSAFDRTTYFPADAFSVFDGREIAETLYWMTLAADEAGLEMPDTPDGAVAEVDEDGTYEVAKDELEIEWFGLDAQRLEVHGVLLVLGGDLTVHGDAFVEGAVYTTGDFSCEALTVRAYEELGFHWGGMLFTSGIQAASASLDHAIVWARGIGIVHPPEQGDVVIDGALEAVASSMDAGDALVADSIDFSGDSALTVRELTAGAMSFAATRIHQVLAITADTLSLASSVVDAAPELTIDVATSTTLSDTEIRTGVLLADLGAATIDAGSLLDVDDGGMDDIQWDASEEDAGIMLEYHTGASHGGYGGSHGNLVFNAFVPALAPVGTGRDPDVQGEGPGGTGIQHLESQDYSYEDGRGGLGGGWIRLAATSLVFDGVASANGGNAAEPGPEVAKGGGGGGAGGSISFRVTGAMSGSGTFNANGGEGTFGEHPDVQSMTGGGGSGGRILVEAGDLSAFTGDAEAVGGRGANGYLPDYSIYAAPWWDTRNDGGPGTWYRHDTTTGEARLTIDGAGFTPSACEVQAYPRCGGVGQLTGDFGDTDVVLRGAIVATGGFSARSLTIEDAYVVPDHVYVRLPWPTRNFYGRNEGDPQLWGPDAKLPAEVWRAPLDLRVAIDVSEDLTVASGGAIDLSGYGGYSRSEVLEDGRFTWSGGSHGGAGGRGRLNGVFSGVPTATYGDPLAPVDVGLGGFSSQDYEAVAHATSTMAGEGGGGLRLTVGGTLQVEGYVGSDGALGRTDDGTNGGAGGSIWITAGALAGHGKVHVHGGTGVKDQASPTVNEGGGGGGGRIAVEADVSGWLGSLGAEGGVGGGSAEAGEDGTIYVNGAPWPPDDGEDEGPPEDDAPAATGGEEAGCSSGGGCATGGGPLPALPLAALVLARRRVR